MAPEVLFYSVNSMDVAPRALKSMPAYRIMESFRLEKTFRITRSNHQPDLPILITEPCPLVPRPHISLICFQGGESTTSLCSPFQCLTTLSFKTFFLISKLNFPWCNLRPFPSILLLVTCCDSAPSDT